MGEHVHIVFADEIGTPFLQMLKNRGHHCEVAHECSAENLEQFMQEADVLVVRSTRVTRSAINAAPQLGLIIRAGAGTDTIDSQAASEQGIYVCNVPGRNAAAVAELTLGLLLAVDRQIPAATADLREGRWAKAVYSNADGLKGRSLAILGLGEIGLEVAQRASAFGLQLRALRRSERSSATLSRISELGIDLYDSLQELLHDVDIASLHLPLTDRTSKFVDRHFLGYLPEGAILLNTARGDLVDEEALFESMNTKDIRVGLDVYEDEPSATSADWSIAIAGHPNFVGTHHIGASTHQAQAAIAGGVVDVIDAYSEGKLVNCVNLVDRPLGAGAISVRHRDEVGALAAVLACLRGAGINVQQMQNEIFAGASPTAAVATIRTSMAPSAQILHDLRQIDAVLRVDISDKG
ncbi:MAG TPA: NAD(P)-dependent oxidoreductase [Acidimicrobiales bacterium]|jgi:D-3-phosphoglycerate dehydrogenase|nr:NAD(P)-dependent oxidoreductase [Acidimicrobiales bacterium]|tara:strand:- start:313 stop:1539 length:1227 start_codon:yes stop_codon:yes gene_type:complete